LLIISGYGLLISRSSVRSRDGPPFKTMGYSLGCSPFLLLGSISGSIFSEFSAKILQVSPGKSRFNNLVILVLFSFVLKWKIERH